MTSFTNHKMLRLQLSLLFVADKWTEIPDTSHSILEAAVSFAEFCLAFVAVSVQR